MTNIASWSTSPDNNTELFPENQLPSTLNNGNRESLAAVAVWYRDWEWIEYGAGSGLGTGAADYTCTQIGAESFRIASADVTAAYHVGRRVRVSGSSTGTLYGTIASASFTGGNTDVTLTMDSGFLASEALRVWLGPSVTNPSWPVRLLYGRATDMNGAELRRAKTRDTRYTSVSANPSSNTVTLDLSLSDTFTVLADQDITTVTITGWPATGTGRGFMLIVTQDGTGNRTITWPGAVKWAGGAAATLSTAGNARDRFAFFSEDGGATIDGITIGKGFS